VLGRDGSTENPEKMDCNDHRRLAYTLSEASAATGVSRRKLYLMRAEGALETFSWGGRTLIRADVLRSAIDQASGRPPAG
jgi:hypothetical protein